jgi:AcrR family transcriptional regulator
MFWRVLSRTMGRPPRHDADHLLAVAGELAARGGPASVTMSAVAKAAGAPSGSVYHRFPHRAALLAALFVGTVEAFQAGFLDALAARAPSAAARHVVAWCRANPTGAAVLVYGARDFHHDDWPASERARLARANRRVVRAVRDLARELGDASARGCDRVRLATVGVPYSIVRRYRGHRMPRHAEELAADAATALLRENVAAEVSNRPE